MRFASRRSPVRSRLAPLQKRGSLRQPENSCSVSRTVAVGRTPHVDLMGRGPTGHMRGNRVRVQNLAGQARLPGGGAGLTERVAYCGRSCAALAMLVCLCALAISAGTGVAAAEVAPPSALPAAT